MCVWSCGFPAGSAGFQDLAGAGHLWLIGSLEADLGRLPAGLRLLGFFLPTHLLSGTAFLCFCGVFFATVFGFIILLRKKSKFWHPAEEPSCEKFDLSFVITVFSSSEELSTLPCVTPSKGDFFFFFCSLRACLVPATGTLTTWTLTEQSSQNGPSRYAVCSAKPGLSVWQAWLRVRHAWARTRVVQEQVGTMAELGRPLAGWTDVIPSPSAAASPNTDIGPSWGPTFQLSQLGKLDCGQSRLYHNVWSGRLSIKSCCGPRPLASPTPTAPSGFSSTVSGQKCPSDRLPVNKGSRSANSCSVFPGLHPLSSLTESSASWWVIAGLCCPGGAPQKRRKLLQTCHPLSGEQQAQVGHFKPETLCL